uniref:Uncharacterized protein n=1 Tax=Glossina austeni TaxID=7395 RepID=A0A1A9VDC3_GLOAU
MHLHLIKIDSKSKFLKHLSPLTLLKALPHLRFESTTSKLKFRKLKLLESGRSGLRIQARNFQLDCGRTEPIARVKSRSALGTTLHPPVIRIVYKPACCLGRAGCCHSIIYSAFRRWRVGSLAMKVRVVSTLATMGARLVDRPWAVGGLLP